MADNWDDVSDDEWDTAGDDLNLGGDECVKPAWDDEGEEVRNVQCGAVAHERA